MPVCEHNVSHRNGPQVMVAGLSLKGMGYRRGACVQVTDPKGDPARVPWEFLVSNDEHATLVCRTPGPPPWIQPGVRIRIEVRQPQGDNEPVPERADNSMILAPVQDAGDAGAKGLSPNPAPAMSQPETTRGPDKDRPQGNHGRLITTKLVLEIAGGLIALALGLIALWRAFQ